MATEALLCLLLVIHINRMVVDILNLVDGQDQRKLLMGLPAIYPSFILIHYHMASLPQEVQFQ